MKYGNLTVIGTSHIAKDSVSRVKEAILVEKPDIVAVELDHARLHVMLSGQKPRFSLSMFRLMGLTGTLFFLIGNFLQRRLGKMIGASPGEEMRAAVELARQNGTRVALIDQPFNITMGRISGISLMEKLKLVRDLLFGITGLEKETQIVQGTIGPIRKSGNTASAAADAYRPVVDSPIAQSADADLRPKANWEMRVELDLTKVPPESFIRMAMKKVKERYPQLYKALVTDRDNYMAKMLATIMRTEPQSKVVAVVGAGHEKEIVRLLKKIRSNN